MYAILKKKRLLEQKEALENRLHDCLHAKVKNPEVVQAAMSDLHYNIVRIENELFLLESMKPFRYTLYAFIILSSLIIIIALCK